MSQGLEVLAAGDDFVPTAVFAGALHRSVEAELTVRELILDWPTYPFGAVGEVSEAAGTEVQVIEALGEARVAVTQLAPFTDQVFAATPALELVVVSRGGPVNVAVDAATERGVTVCYAPGRNATAAAEFTIGLMLATCRNIVAGSAALADGGWHERYFRYDNSGYELEGSTVGLVGYGAIGHRVGALLAAFGAEVLVYDPYTPAEAVTAGVTKVDDLDALLGRSRIVSLHARQTAETRGMIGARELALLPEGAVVVNSARGGLLDEDALCDALDAGHLAGAGLDTFAGEPPAPRARIRRTNGVTLTPHIAGCSRETAERAAEISAAEVARWTRGEPPANCANPAVLQRRGRT